MTVEDLLIKYPWYKAALRKKEIEIWAIREEVIGGTNSGSGERVQTSGLSDTTSSKAIKLITETETLEKEMAVYKFKVDLIDNALTILSEKERDVIERIFFKRQTYSKVDYETRIPRDTCKTIKRNALAKLKPFVDTILD